MGDIPLPDERVSIQPYIMLGIDYGYVSGVRRLRENDFQIGVTGSYALTEHLELFASVSRSFALSNLNAIGEGNVTWGTVGIGLAF